MFIYLASKSPRRQELLKLIGINFECLHMDVAESPLDEESAQDYYISKIEGSYDSVMGLPLHLVKDLIAEFNYKN